MKRRLLLVVSAVTLLFALALSGVPAAPGPEGSATGSLGVAYADEVDPTPTPTATPPSPTGSCQGSNQCGD